MTYENNYLAHFGINGQRWGIRRYQNEDGTLTEEGKKRYRVEKDYVSRYDHKTSDPFKEYDQQVDHKQLHPRLNEDARKLIFSKTLGIVMNSPSNVKLRESMRSNLEKELNTRIKGIPDPKNREALVKAYQAYSKDLVSDLMLFNYARYLEEVNKHLS